MTNQDEKTPAPQTGSPSRAGQNETVAPSPEPQPKLSGSTAFWKLVSGFVIGGASLLSITWYRHLQLDLAAAKYKSEADLQKKASELSAELERQKAMNEAVRIGAERRSALLKSYLGESGDATWAYRLIVARFIAATDEDKKVSEWANEEKQIAQAEVQRLEDSLAACAENAPCRQEESRKRVERELKPKFTPRRSCELCLPNCISREYQQCYGNPKCEADARQRCDQQCKTDCG
jgi:hypothetical protein